MPEPTVRNLADLPLDKLLETVEKADLGKLLVMILIRLDTLEHDVARIRRGA